MGGTMRKIYAINSILLMLFFSLNIFSQTPQYYNSIASGIGNSIPFGSISITGYKVQWLIGPGEYNQPTNAPAGNITKYYIYMSTAGSGTYSNLTIKMGQASITSFTGEYMGQLD